MGQTFNMTTSLGGLRRFPNKRVRPEETRRTRLPTAAC